MENLYHCHIVLEHRPPGSRGITLVPALEVPNHQSHPWKHKQHRKDRMQLADVLKSCTHAACRAWNKTTRPAAMAMAHGISPLLSHACK
jgi:hypothetical protein